MVFYEARRRYFKKGSEGEVCRNTCHRRLNIQYESPSFGVINFGWNNPPTVNHKTIDLRHHYRYDNPFCKAELNTKKIEINYKDKNLIMTL